MGGVSVLAIIMEDLVITMEEVSVSVITIRGALVLVTIIMEVDLVLAITITMEEDSILVTTIMEVDSVLETILPILVYQQEASMF
mgnify:CR=1 FL=1